MTNKIRQEYEVLARKYRPGKLSELIGQDMLVRTLTNAIDSDRIPHAFILTGIRGVGKTSTARIIARSLICTGKDNKTEKPTINPCGKCDNCLAVAEDRHVDILEMDAASHTGVAEIREIIENVHYAPVMARYKVYIIDEVHMLSKSAFNALLKTLEEPPLHTKFIFATTEIRKIPVTILSRCMRFDLARVDSDLLTGHMANIAKEEGAKIKEDALSIISLSVEGSVRDALSLLDQAISNSGNAENIDKSDIQKMLGIASKGNIFNLFQSVTSGNAVEAIENFREMYRLGADPITILQDLLELSHFLTQIKLLPDLVNEIHTTEEDKKRGKELSGQISLPFLARLWQMFLKGLEEVKIAPNSLVAAEMVLVRVSYASELPTPGDLVKDINKNKNNSDKELKSPPVKEDVMQGQTSASLNKIEEKFYIKNPSNFNELINIFEEKGENIVCGRLQEVGLIKFDPEERRIEFSPAKTTPSNLAGKIGELLTDWTGNRWVASVSNEVGNKSLRDKKEEDLEKRKIESSEDKRVKDILSAFPGSSVKTIEEISAEEPQLEKNGKKIKTGEN